ncbi:lasso RiPP family leader peptide-containing protein [Saccharopolyspora cebuensis]|uniref:Lasso RiPP family leader peptide-containing protein n=1 Tax=Saccharopolyspora cebuensis TaxID=418759 RepID=A0ABV4CJB7_9PSEU
MDETAYTAPELAEIGDFATETLGGGGYIFDVLYVIRW